MNADPMRRLSVVSELVTTGVGHDAIERVSVAVPVPHALMAEILTEVVPLVVGVPVIAPVDVLTDSPLGNPVAP